jgi:aminomethyltransferase
MKALNVGIIGCGVISSTHSEAFAQQTDVKLKWACDLNGDFIGKEGIVALLSKGLERKLVTLSLTEKGVPREGYEVLSSDGEVIGEVVSGLYAPTVDKYCANAFVQVAYAKAGTELQVSLRGRIKKAVVEKRPLYRPSYR